MRRNTILLLTIALLSTARTMFAGPILITEVFYDTPGTESKEEWIEIYNPTLNPVAIGGYKIKDNTGTYTIVSGTVIQPGQVLIFARSTEGFKNLFGFNPDFGNLNLSLANNGDLVSLEDTGQNPIDMVAWENFVSGWGLVADEGESIQRKSFGYEVGDWLSHRTPNPGSPAPIPEPTSILLLGVGLIALKRRLIVKRR